MEKLCIKCQVAIRTGRNYCKPCEMMLKRAGLVGRPRSPIVPDRSHIVFTSRRCWH